MENNYKKFLRLVLYIFLPMFFLLISPLLYIFLIGKFNETWWQTFFIGLSIIFILFLIVLETILREISLKVYIKNDEIIILQNKFFIIPSKNIIPISNLKGIILKDQIEVFRIHYSINGKIKTINIPNEKYYQIKKALIEIAQKRSIYISYRDNTQLDQGIG